MGRSSWCSLCIVIAATAISPGRLLAAEDAQPTTFELLVVGVDHKPAPSADRKSTRLNSSH